MRVFGRFPFESFRCRCGENHPTVLSPELIKAVIDLMDIVGDIVVTSGQRCRGWNEKVGGSEHSRHIKGEAIDFKVPGMSLEECYEIVSEIDGIGGIGLYSEGFVHIDVRQKKARWSRVSGRYGAIEAILEVEKRATKIMG